MSLNGQKRTCQFVLWIIICMTGGCTPGPPESGRDTVDVGMLGDTGEHTDTDGDGDAGSPDSDNPDAQGGDTGDGSAASAGDFVIATFNVFDLFDTVCDTGDCGPNDFEPELSQASYDARLADVATAIDSFGADVVLLQEIENEAVLHDLNAALSQEYPVVVQGEQGRDASLDTAILARGQLVSTRDYDRRDLVRPDGSHTSFTRQFLRADLDIDGSRVIVFSAHFKSKYNDDAGRRLAEASQARMIVDQAAADDDQALVVMGGDLNDTSGSPTLTELSADGGLAPITADRPLADVYTYVYLTEREVLDHLLVAPGAGGVYVDGSAHSVHDRQPAGLGGSDHGALVGSFEMR